MNELLKTYTIASIFGIINEIMVSGGTNHCIEKFDWKCLLSMTVFNIYGWILMIIMLILSRFDKMSDIWKIILIFFGVLILECVFGKMSYLWHNKQTWNYNDKLLF